MTDINEDLRKQVVAKFGFSESQLRDPNVRAFVDARVGTFKPAVPATPATEDTPSTTLGDWLLEGQKAVSNAIQMVPNMVSGVGSMLDPEFAQTPFGHAMQFTSDLYGNYTNKLASEQSPAFQAANSAKIYDDATGEWHMPTATQAASTVLNAAAMLPAIIAGGGAATAGLSVAKLPSLIGGIAKLSGAGTKTAAKLGLAGNELAAARTAAAAHVGKVGTGAAGMGVIGGAAGSGDAYNEAYGAVLQTLDQNRIDIATEDAHRLASTLAREAAIKQLPISILTNAVGLGGAKAVTGGMWKRIAKGALIDAVPEVVEEGGQGVVVNATVREIDPSRDLMAGVRTRAALGLIAGGVMGGGMAGFEGVVDNHEQRQLALIAEGKQRREAMLAELNRPAADIINTPAQPLMAPPSMTPAVQPPAIAAPEAPPADVGVQRTPEVQKAWKDAENVIGMAQDANDHLDEAIPGWAEMPHEQKRDRINAALAATDEEAAVDPAIGKLRTWAERQAAAMTSLASATAADHGIQVTHADLDAIGAAAEAAPAVHAAEPAAAPKAPETVLQNRDRSSSASIEQMQSISQKPDYLRLASSNSLAEGAPVVFGDIPATAVVGKSQQVATSKGDRIPVQYAAVEADDLVASHNSDGTPVAEYANGVPGKLRAIAGNGRVAGLKLAYSKNRAGDYAAEMAADDSHGISADAIKGMRNPVLVRVMPADKVTPDIGDVSNTSGTATLSPAEMATNDIRRIDLQAIAFDEDGEVTEQSVMQFIQSMPIGERAGLMDGKRPARAAYDRLNAAIFAQAYGDPELIRLYAQAADGEAKNVMRGLAIAAPHMARLEGAGDLDIRPIVAEAATIAVNAGRKKQTLAKYLETNDPLIRRDSRVVAAMFAAHGRSAKTVGERLSDAAKFAHTEATKSTEPDMFGDVQPKATREDVTRGITDGTFEARPQSVGEPAGSVADGGHAVGQEGRLDEARGDAGKTAAGTEGEVKPLLSAQEAPKEAPKAPRASNVDMFAKTPEEDAKQRLADEIARLRKKQDANAETAAKLPDGPLFDGTAQQQSLPTASRPIAALIDIRPPKESLADTAASLSNATKVLGNKTVSIDTLVGGVGNEVGDQKRVKDLAAKLAQPDAYIERLIVDDAGNVIEGQHRLDALRLLGVKDVPVVVIQDFERNFPTDKVREAITATQKMPSDNANQMAAHLAEIYADEKGNIAKIRQYEAPAGFQKAWDAGIAALESNQPQGAQQAASPVAAAAQAQSASAPTIADEEKAIAILDAADVRGKERLDAISKVRSGEYTLDDLKGAYPAKAVQKAAQDSALADVVGKPEAPEAKQPAQPAGKIDAKIEKPADKPDDAPTFSMRADKQEGGPRLSAIHNLSAENILFADKMGGIAVPSIGVVTDERGGVDGFGEITLIGTKGMADPSAEPVFSSDAYTTRFPRPVYKAAKTKDADKLVAFIRPWADKFDDTDAKYRAFENTHETPDPQELISRALGSRAWIGAYLDSIGIESEPVMRDRPMRDIQPEWADELRPLYDAIDHSAGAGAILESQEYEAFVKKAAELAYEFNKKYKLKDRGTAEEIAAGFSYAAYDRIGRDLRDQGKKEIDPWATTEKMRALVETHESDFKRFVEDKVLPMMGEPMLKIGRKHAEYTLENIVEQMTSAKVRNEEKTMTYGAGMARSATAEQFKDLERMREIAQQIIVDPNEYNAKKKETDALLSDYRDRVSVYYNGSTWDAMDSAMKAIAVWGTGKVRGKFMLTKALQKVGFSTREIPGDIIDLAMKAGNALLDAPVPYFEAKPQRSVSLDEFAGAVIPASTQADVRAVLDKYGIKYREYSGDSSRLEEVRALTLELSAEGKDVLFQARNTRAKDKVGDKIGLTVPEVQKIVDGMKAGAGNLKVVADFDDLPQDIRDEAMKMRAEKGDIKAAHHRGTSYLVASNLSRNEVSRAAFHEVFVHGGLRNRYGMSIEAKMISLASKLEGTGKPSERVMALAKKQDINLSAYVRSLNNDTTKSNRQKLAILTEELLAHMGETTGSLRAYLEEIVGAIRQFLRNIGLADLADLGVTDLRNELRLARKAAIEAEGNAGTPSFSSRAAGPETGGIAQPGGRGVDYKHEIRPLDQLLRDANTSLDLNGRGRIGLVAGEWAEPSRYRAELGRKNAFIAEEDRVATAEEGRVEQERLIAAAKENGFFIGPSHPLLKALTLHENKRGMEHDAYIVGEEKGRVVIRSTLPGSFGHANKHSPAYYLKRIAEYNQVFPNIQVRLIGVGQNEDGSAVILTAQAFVAGKEYDTEAELDAAMRKQGWFAIGVLAKGLPARYQHKETKAIISDVHVGNILHIGDELFPIDVIVEKMPKASGGKNNEPPKFKLVSDSSPEAGKQFVISDESMRDLFIRKIQDKFNRVKTVQRAIEESTGQQLPDYLNVYQQEELTHGKSETALREFEEKHVDPLIAAMSKAKVTREELDEYLYAAHAKERNDYIAEINPSMPDNGSGMTYKDAAAILKAWQADPRYIDMVDLAKRVYAINEERLNTIERAGLESPETIAQWRRYEAYVPLKGTAEKSGWTNKVGQGFSVKGKESKQAMGRNTRAESPLLHSIGQTEQTLLRAEKNHVAQSFLKLAEEFPNADLWEVIDSPKADLVRRFDKKSREVEWVPNTHLRNDDDVFVVKVGGVEKYIRIYDERLLTAMKNLGPEPLDALSSTLGRVNRVLAMVNTSLNPEFVISNFARDIQTAIANLETEFGRDDPKLPQRVTKQVIADIPSAVRGIYHALRKTEGKQDLEWVKLFNEFREDGGQIGFFGLSDYETKAADLQKRLSEANGDWQALGKKHANDFLEFIMDANSSIENATRLSAYKAARDVGVSRQKAASLAKNLTVNFNRKGELGALINSFYLFANASIQGTAQLGRVLTSKKGKYIAGGAALAAVLLSELNRMLAGEDDDDRNFYDKVPDHVKERNLILMKWWDDKGGYMTLPLPYGYNIFSVAGNLVSDMAHGKPPSQAAVSMAGVLVGAFSPLGSSASQSAAGWLAKLASPTILDPALELAMNENFAGQKIFNQGFPYATPLPDSALFWRSTSEVAKWAASSMNMATGGSDFRSGGIDISPDSIEHLFSFATGGAGGFVGRAVDVAAKLAEGEDIPQNKIPFARKVSAEVNPKDDVALYYDRRDLLKQIEDERAANRREGGQALTDFQQRFGRQVSLLPMVKATDKQLKQLRDQRKRIESAKVPDSMKQPRLKQIDTQIKATVDRFNKRYGEVVGN